MTRIMKSELYLKDLATTLYKFQQENILCDTVLIAEDNCKVWAHSVILAAVSPHIYTNFLSITGRRAKCRFSMKLTGCSSACIEAVLHFLYTGSLVLPSRFRHPNQFSGILMVCERMGIDVTKLNGIDVRFGDVSSLETSAEDCLVCEEGIHDNAAFSACLKTENTFDILVAKEIGSIGTLDNASDTNLSSSRQGFSPEASDRLKTEDGFASVRTDSDKLEMTDFEQATNCNDDLKLESLSVKEPIFIAPDYCALSGTMSSTCKTSKPVSRMVPQGSPVAWVSILKSSKASAIRRSTSIRLASKILQKIVVKKNRTVDGDLRFVHNESNSLDSTNSETEQLKDDKGNLIRSPVRERQFTSQSGLRKHLGKHVSDQLALACKLCNKVFTSAPRLQAHEKMHAGDRPHICPTCGKTYRFRSSLIQHSHAHNEKRPYLCDICGTGFALAVNLRRHKMARHSNVRPFVCRECGRGFVRDYLLRQHMENHTGQRSNICPLCGKSFSHRGNLNRHVRNHDGEKQHVCIVCGRAFNRKSNMEKHMLSHTGLNSILTHQRDELQRQQHACNECHKVFRSAKMLSRHASMHSSEKSFTCSVCAKRFTTSRYLQQHLVVHQEKHFKCNICAKMFASEKLLSGHIRKFHSDVVESLPGD